MGRSGIIRRPAGPKFRGHWRDLRAFTLLEVILALVILGGALAVFGEVMQLANRSAADARAETQAQLLASTLMDEIIAGVRDDSSATRQPIDVADATNWVYSVNAGTSDIQGVYPLEVIVEQDLEPQFNPVKYRLVRWLPTVAETSEMMEEATANQQRGGGASGGSAGGGVQP
jgi:prepilin-type N-terminal cleavage/methylation domain-containing protein